MLIIIAFINKYVYICIMKVLETERFSVHIHEVDHPPPHCHVRFSGNEGICVMIPLLEPMYGATINRDVRSVLEDSLDMLADTWERLHPKRIEVPKKKNVAIKYKRRRK